MVSSSGSFLSGISMTAAEPMCSADIVGKWESIGCEENSLFFIDCFREEGVMQQKRDDKKHLFCLLLVLRGVPIDYVEIFRLEKTSFFSITN